jgi:hypothetical protein
MLDRHRSHLVSTYTTVLQHLGEIRQVITAGRSPGGALLTPLPEPLRDQLVDRIDRIAAGLEELVRHFVPAWEHTAAETGGLAATKMWTAILLRTVEELVEDLEPKQIGKHYGAVGEHAAETLEQRVRKVLADIREGIDLLG